MNVEALKAILTQTLEAERVPGIALAVARGDEPPRVLCLGEDAAGRAIQFDSLFPVASVTKLATALAVLRLVDAGALGLDDPLADHLPEATAARPGVTLRSLLSHLSGLPGDLPDGAAPYDRDLTWSALATACLRVEPEREPGTYVQYSNINMGLLAIVVERRTEQAFGDALGELVLEPLGVEGYLGREPARPPVVLTGIHSEHVGTELEPYNSAFWRSLALPWGGMLTTPAGALALARAFAGRPPGFLRPETAAEATRDQTGGLAGGMMRPLLWDPSPWGLGAELRGTKTPHWAPREADPGSFGHAGASGCYAWVDRTPSRPEVAWAMLGARSMESGWLLRAGPRIGAVVLEWARAER